MTDTSEHIIHEPEEAALTSLEPTLELVLRRIRLRARRRIAWLRKIWSESGSNGKEQSNYHSEVDGYLNNADTPEVEALWMEYDEGVQPWNKALKDIEEMLSQDSRSRLTLLKHLLGLNPVEMDILQACLAISVEPNLGRVYAYLNDHSGRGYVTEELAARLFGHGRCLPLSVESPLKIWGLVVEANTGSGEPPRQECDPYIRNWLLGMDELDEALIGIARIQPYREPLENWPLADAVDFATKILNSDRQQIVRLFIAGAEGSGRRSFAACISREIGLQLLTVDSDRIPETRWQQLFMRVQRQAFLTRSAVAWHGTSIKERPWPQHVPPFRLQFVIGEVDEFMPSTKGVVDYRTEMPPISLEECHRLWLQLIPAASDWPAAELESLIRRHQTDIGQIVAAAEKEVDTVAEASELLRSSSRRRLGNLARQMTSAFQWEDLVVPDWIRGNLEDFAFEASERALLWERPEAQRLFPQGRGLVALFTGPPGTGKTMAAQVIASALQLDLFRIDLSSVVSKYVGETSKNLERILSRAQRMDAVLLFDEADALFGKRTDVKDAHDRFANTDTNYLLQAIEQYPGVAILASNKKANIDAGFTRRLRYVVDFPKPDAQQRLQLWRQVTAELLGPAATLDADLGRLAEAVELTGAQIKYAILSAIFIARKEKTEVTMQHLLRGLERELMKEGHGLGRQAQEMLKRQR